MYRLTIVLWLVLAGCKVLQPGDATEAGQRYDCTLLIRFVEGQTSYQEVIHALSGTPGHLSVEPDYNGNIFHTDKITIRVRYLDVNREQIDLLKTRLARLGALELTEQRN